MTTKEKLIASALKLFNQKGFENTSTTSICTDAGFSSGALFVHFKTKNELLDYLYVDTKKKYFEVVFGDFDHTVAPDQKFMDIMKRSFKYYLENYESYNFMKNFANSTHISRIARSEIEDDMKVFSEIYIQGVEKGVFKDQDMELTLTATSGMFYSLVEHIKHHPNTSIDSCIDIIMRTMLK